MGKSAVERAADNIRALTVSMVEKAKSGHPGGAMGGADFISLLYAEYLSFDPDDMAWPFRDRFFLDPGHMSPMLYSILRLIGCYTQEELESFRQWGSPTHGHPELNLARGVENSSGPLGIGHAMALGSAIGERFYRERFGEWCSHKTYAFISDGGMQEEISQGVGRIAGHLKLSNFVMFFDSNDIQLSHTTDKTITEDTEAKYRSWGWRVETVNGNDMGELRAALDRANNESSAPTLIIGKTIMGLGSVDSAGNSFERQVSTHGQPMSAAGADVEATLTKIGADPKNPFAVFPDVSEYFDQILDKKRKEAAEKRAIHKAWAEENPAKAEQLNKMLSGELAVLDFSQIATKEGVATRVTSGDALAYFAETVETMIVSSADLSNSDNTGKFLSKTTELQGDDFSGAFLQAGVAELTMAAIMNGLALHGGIIPVCGTFFVFSDYMKPAIRMAALMGLPVKYVFTHDSFRVGEDGPTHQPVEQEAQIRLLEKMQNLEGKRSMLVLRPSDSAETLASWKLALENRTTPTALILTRQNVAALQPTGESRFDDAFSGTGKGGYIVHAEKGSKLDLILLANGSEVALLCDAAKTYEQDGLSVRVISMPSEGLFLEQSESYRNGLIPFGVPVFAYSAGLPEVFRSVVGPLGIVMGREAFGASAPASVLDEKFGYTVEAVRSKIDSYLSYYKDTLLKLSSL